jgi:hypothetical protein
MTGVRVDPRGLTLWAALACCMSSQAQQQSLQLPTVDGAGTQSFAAPLPAAGGGLLRELDELDAYMAQLKKAATRNNSVPDAGGAAAAYRLGLIHDKAFERLGYRERRDCREAVRWYVEALSRSGSGHVGACERLLDLAYREPNCFAEQEGPSLQCTAFPGWSEYRLKGEVQQGVPVAVDLPEVLIGGVPARRQVGYAIEHQNLPDWLTLDKEQLRVVASEEAIPPEFEGQTAFFVVRYMGFASPPLEVEFRRPAQLGVEPRVAVAAGPDVYDGRWIQSMETRHREPVESDDDIHVLRKLSTEKGLPAGIVLADALFDRGLEERYSAKVHIAAPVFDVAVQVVVPRDTFPSSEDEGLTSLLSNARIGILGARGGNEERVFRKAIVTHPMPGDAVFASDINELMDALDAGEIGGVVVVSGYPAHKLTALDQRQGARGYDLLPLRLNDRDLMESTLTPEVYSWLPAPVPTVATTALLLHARYLDGSCSKLRGLQRNLHTFAPRGVWSYRTSPVDGRRATEDYLAAMPGSWGVSECSKERDWRQGRRRAD